MLFKRALWGFEDLVTLSAGLGVTGLVSDKRQIHHGLQVDFNIWFNIVWFAYHIILFNGLIFYLND